MTTAAALISSPFKRTPSNREGRSLSIISDSSSIASVDTVDDTASESSLLTPPSSPPLLSDSFSPFIDTSLASAPAPSSRRARSRSQTRDYFTFALLLNPPAATADGEDVKTPGIHSATGKSTPAATPSADNFLRSPALPRLASSPVVVPAATPTSGWTFVPAETLAAADVRTSSSDEQSPSSNAATASSSAPGSPAGSPAVMVSRPLSRPVSMPSLPNTPSLSPFLSPSSFPAPPPRRLPSSAPPRPRSSPVAFSGALAGDPSHPHHHGLPPSSPPALPIAQRRRAPTSASATLSELDPNAGFRLNLGSLPPVFVKMQDGAGPSRGRAPERAIGLGLDKDIMNKTAATSAQVAAGRSAASTTSSKMHSSSSRPRLSPSTSRRGSSASSGGIGHGLRQWPGLGWGRRGSESSGGAQYAVATPSANGGMASHWSPDSDMSDDERDDSDEEDAGDEPVDEQIADESEEEGHPTITVQYISPPTHTAMRKSLSADSPPPHTALASPTRASRVNSPRSISLPSRPHYTRSWTSSPGLPPHQVGSQLSPVPASPFSASSSSDSLVRVVTTPAETLVDARDRLVRRTGVAVGMTRSASANSATSSPWAWSAGSKSGSGDGYLMGKAGEMKSPPSNPQVTVRREVNPYFPVF